MKLSVRNARFPADRGQVVALLSRELDGFGSEAKFEWLYHENPLGPARVWVLENDSGKIVGVSAAFPRELQVRDQILRAWVLGDFCVARNYRSLGPALALQGAACKAVERGEIDAWYDFPSTSMLAVHRRLGMTGGGQLFRFVRLLRVDGLVETRFAGTVAQGASRVANALLSSRDALQRRDSRVEVASYEGHFREFSSRELIARDAVSVRHTPSYLTWRYRQDPRHHSTIIGARRQGVWDAAVAIRWDGQSATIADVIGLRDVGILRELILEAVRVAREKGLERINVLLSAGHPLTSTFETLGFHRRESGRFTVDSKSGRLPGGMPWNLMDGDRDL